MGANIDLLTGIRVTTQAPLDPKGYFKTLADMKDLGVSNRNAFTYYDSMKAICAENREEYIWRDRDNDDEIGLLDYDFVYPDGSIVDGTEYSFRVFNFFEFKKEQEIPKTKQSVVFLDDAEGVVIADFKEYNQLNINCIGDIELIVEPPELEDGERESRMIYLKPNDNEVIFRPSLTSKMAGFNNFKKDKESWIVISYAMKEDVLTQFANMTVFPFEAGTGPGPGAGVISGNIIVSQRNGRTVGKYVHGDEIPSDGWTLDQFAKGIAIDYIPPVFTAYWGGGQSLSEVGTTLSGDTGFGWQFNLNSGVIATVDVYDITAGATIISAAPNTGSVDYTYPNPLQLNADGASQSWKIIGNNSTGSNIESPAVTKVARFRRWWRGATSPITIDPTDGQANRDFIRSRSSSDLQFPGENVFTLETGTVDRIFYIELPPGRTIISVTDTTNLNADLTPDYVLSSVTIKDAGGTDRAYNRYTLTLGSAYDISANHVIRTN